MIKPSCAQIPVSLSKTTLREASAADQLDAQIADCLVPVHGIAHDPHRVVGVNAAATVVVDLVAQTQREVRIADHRHGAWPVGDVHPPAAVVRRFVAFHSNVARQVQQHSVAGIVREHPVAQGRGGPVEPDPVTAVVIGRDVLQRSRRRLDRHAVATVAAGRHVAGELGDHRNRVDAEPVLGMPAERQVAAHEIRAGVADPHAGLPGQQVTARTSVTSSASSSSKTVATVYGLACRSVAVWSDGPVMRKPSSSWPKPTALETTSGYNSRYSPVSTYSVCPAPAG